MSCGVVSEHLDGHAHVLGTIQPRKADLKGPPCSLLSYRTAAGKRSEPEVQRAIGAGVKEGKMVWGVRSVETSQRKKVGVDPSRP